ncbi:MAG: hypothetical protein ACRCVU_12365 [Flavobacterium sp.]
MIFNRIRAEVIEAILAIKSIIDNVIPLTINIENLDPSIPCGVHIVQKV